MYVLLYIVSSLLMDVRKADLCFVEELYTVEGGRNGCLLYILLRLCVVGCVLLEFGEIFLSEIKQLALLLIAKSSKQLTMPLILLLPAHLLLLLLPLLLLLQLLLFILLPLLLLLLLLVHLLLPLIAQ